MPQEKIHLNTFQGPVALSLVLQGDLFLLINLCWFLLKRAVVLAYEEMLPQMQKG